MRAFLHKILQSAQLCALLSVMDGNRSIPEWNLADRLEKARKTAGVSVQQMADFLGVSRNTVSNYTGGRIVPDQRTLMLWAQLTEVDFEWLKGDWQPGRRRVVTGRKHMSRRTYRSPIRAMSFAHAR